MKHQGFKIKNSTDERSLKVVAVVLSCLFAIAMMYPLFFTISNAMKDNVSIYDIPPAIFPRAAQSLTVVLDYSGVEAQNAAALTDVILRDNILTLFGLQYKLHKESMFEIQVYGIKDGITLFHSRAHQTKLQLERDYGIYRGTIIKPNILLHEDRYVRASEAIGYELNLSGLNLTLPNMGADWSEKTLPLLTDKYPVTGKVVRTDAHTNNLLLAESFKYYWRMPAYAYPQSASVVRFGFLAFVGNSVIVIGFAILAQVFLCSICAYVISRLLSPRAGRIVLMYFLGAMMIPFASIMLPQLIMYRQIGAYNNYWALLLPFLYPYGFFVFLYKGFFDKIPSSYFEAAELDGASHFYLYTRILMPLSKSIIALIALQTFIGNWNDFFWAWMVTEDQSLWTLNVALYNLSVNTGTKQNAILGLSILTTLPVILLSIVFSKQLKQSVIASGIKG